MQTVFKRYEKKYLLTSQQYSALRCALADRMQTDSYGLHTIRNIYFDTDDFLLIRRSLEKPVYKEKFRLRHYGEEATVFMELKKKYKGEVFKRRVPVTHEEALHYLLCGRLPDRDGQILREIRVFLTQYRLKPRLFLSYEREALFGKDDPLLRITFDCNIRFRTDGLTFLHGNEGTELLPPNTFLMEIKVGQALPLWLSALLDGLGIYPCSFSKYGKCYTQYLCRRPAEEFFVEVNEDVRQYS